MFICNHCPFVVNIRKELVAIASEYMEQGLGVVAISSNSIQTHPQVTVLKDFDFKKKKEEEEEERIKLAFSASLCPNLRDMYPAHRMGLKR